MKSKSTSNSNLLMLFRSPLQSWGSDSRFNSRFTMEHPTKSGILGVIGSAMGIERDDEYSINELNKLKIDIVSAYDKGIIIKDFQVVGAGYDKTIDIAYILHKKDGKLPVVSPGQGVATAITNRYYLCDYVFFVIISGSEEILLKIKKGLENPVYNIFFGRKCNIPSEIIFRGIFDNMSDIAEYIVSYLKESKISTEKVNIIEDSSSMSSFSINDVPINYKNRTYKTRIVSHLTPEEYFKNASWNI